MCTIQIGDLHIDSSFDISVHRVMLEKMYQTINALAIDTDILIVTCGDIVNMGDPNGYKIAETLFSSMKDKLNNKNIDFLFVPGNHDQCDCTFDSFDTFSKSFVKRKIPFLNKNEHLVQCGAIQIMLVNSSFHKDYNFGKIDIESLENSLNSSTKKPLIIVMHHTLINRYDDDHSAVTDGYKFIELINKKDTIAILHGHTHGISNIVVGEKSRVIGVGSLFSYISNCNNQFNIIDVSSDVVQRVDNYRYNSDIGDYSKICLFENTRKNYFSGVKTSETYCQIKKATVDSHGITNLCMEISSDLESYIRDMKDCFKDSIETAKDWLAEDCPSHLYYNHGQYMISGNENAISYVTNELIKNSTSNRAFIPLMCFNDVSSKNKHLPGLASIQFGFNDDTKTKLFCTVYLRSLEVNHFFKINLSEIFLLVQELKEKIRSITNININLYAFKVQFKENFSCFQKAEIDKLTSGDIASLIFNNKTSEIIDLLENKFAINETVVNLEGLNLFFDILEKSQKYDNEASALLKEIIEDTNRLKDLYNRTSNYHEIEPEETGNQNKQHQLIDFFKGLKNHE